MASMKCVSSRQSALQRSSAVPTAPRAVASAARSAFSTANAFGTSRVPVSRARKQNTIKAAVMEKPGIQYDSKGTGNTSSVLAIILGGGAGSRLYPLTKERAKPAVSIGGVYRLIDVPMSNCINSGINKIYILTQFNSTSLNRHLAKTYNSGSGVRFGEGFIEVLAATQTPGDLEWFKGTADAVRQYAWLLEDVKNRVIDDVVILSGDHLYRMDYMKFVNQHRKDNADITIGCIAYDSSRAKEFGLMKINDKRRVLSFAEKPKTDEALNAMKVDTTVLGLTPEEAVEKPFIASMGIYVFKKQALLDLLLRKYPTADDFGGEIIPEAAKDMNVVAYPFSGYWEDVGTIKSYFEENLKMARSPAPFEFYDPGSPIYTSPRVLPPAYIENSKVSDAIIAHGCKIKNATVSNAVIGLRAIINDGCVVQDAMVAGADYFETAAQRGNKMPIGIGENTVLSNCIIDKNARIGKNVKITNKNGIEDAKCEDKGYMIRSGIVVVMKDAVIPDGTEI